MDFPGRLLAAFMVLILIFIFPLQYIAGLYGEDIDSMVDDRTHQLTDTIRDRGYLDEHMYEEYVGFLASTRERYDIEIQDIRPVKGEDCSFNNSPGVNRTSMRLSHSEIVSFATHSHTAACYAGDLHVCNGTDCEFEDSVEPGILLLTGLQTTNASGNTIFRNYFLYSTSEGETWRRHTPGAASLSQDITYGPDKCYYFINNNRIYKYNPSTNTTSSVSSFSSTHDKREVMYRNHRFFVTETVPSTSSVNTRIYRSISATDANNFVAIQLSHRVNISNIAYGNNMYIAAGNERKTSPVASNKLIIYSSEDGIRWDNSFVADLNSTNGVRDIIFAGDRFICGTTDGYIYYSYNGIDWVYKGRPTASGKACTEIRDIVFGNGILVISSSGGNLFYSTDQGQSYSHTNYLFNNINDINYYNGFFYAGNPTHNDTTEPVFYKSTNITEWTPISKYPFIPYSDWKSYYMESLTDIAFNSIGDTGFPGNCIKKDKYYDGNGNEIQPVCHQVVTSISATPSTQTVDKGKPISLTVTATYLDGHTATISNYTTNYDSNKVGTQTVTITYSGLVGNAKTTGTITCTLSVIVRLDKTLTSITVLPSTQTVSRYSSPSFTVRAYYSDGTNRLLNSSEYIMAGFNSASLGLQNVTISYTENGVKKTATVKVTVIALQKECPRCNQLYELNPDDTDPGCPFCKEIITGIEVTPAYVELTQGESLPITVMGIYKDGSKRAISGWSSNYDPDRLGLQIVTIEYGGHAKDITVWLNYELIACPICNTKYPKSESKCPVCAEKVVSISASPREVTIMQFENISLTVTAIYADGSSREVDEWSIDRTSMVPGTFKATVSYKGVTDIITMTVLSINSIECPICETIYDLIDNPTGCPICSKELVGIEAYLTSGTNLVQLGTRPNIAIILIFRDEHREFASDGYSLEDFKPHELGIQTIRVIYKEFTTTIVVEVVNMLDTITCPNGHVYHKNEDGTDPGCPFCYTGENTSNIVYFDITYTTEILDAVYLVGVYHFQEGNYISIIVTKKDKSLQYRLQKTFFGTSMLGRKKRFIYGGEVY
ncbi:MAG: hypothetical protein EWM47_05590 [Anaerolineaceae bacterium]|nr:MAG: hypothetical protein EWM47_05590 [Anaerolineaceae bacterium]